MKITMETFDNDHVLKDYCYKAMKRLKERGFAKSPVKIEYLIQCYKDGVSGLEAIKDFQNP